MTAREAKKQYLLREWCERVAERNRSGLSVKKWCEENGIKERNYHYWLKQVREYAVQMMDAVGSPHKRGAAASSEMIPYESGSAELSVPDGWAVCALTEQPKLPAKALPIEIGKCRVLADETVDPELLAKVCKALVSIC